jgi:Protein of unknown function (DUF3515)
VSETSAAARTATLVAVPVTILVALGSAWWLGAFRSHTAAPPRPQATTPVAVAAPSLAGPQATACRALLSHLPDAVRDRRRRPVTAGAEQNAAYGDPAITLSCGVAAVTPPVGADVYPLSGVCWYSQPGAGGTVWTTVDRTVPVRVTVPSAYDSPGQWVIAFSTPIAAELPVSPSAPAGC